MFCSNCGNRLADGAKFCSACGSRVQDSAGQEFRFGDDVVFKEPTLDTGAASAPEERPASRRESISFDWSTVVDEPHKREIPDVKSPWATTGGIDEKELYAEMTPSTDRSRTMSFIDVLKAEKEEKEKKAEQRAFVYTDVLEVDADMSSFNDAPTLNYAPLYDDVDEPVKTPFDNVERKTDRRTFDNVGRKTDRRTLDNVKTPSVEMSRETIAQFDEYVKSFEAGAGIVHDEPRFEKPAPAKPVSDEPRFELPDFLKRAASPAKDEPVFETAADAAVSLEELSGAADIDFRKDVIDEPTFEVPKIEETVDEPVFEEPKYEEPVFEELKFDDDDFDDGFNEYLDLDTTREIPAVDEEALFAEMKKTSPSKTGMTIAAPADKEDEIEALRKRLMELTGTDIKIDETPAAITMEPETTSDIDKYFDGLASASDKKKTAAPAQSSGVNPEDLYLDAFPAAEPEPELLILEKTEKEKAAPAPAAEEVKTETPAHAHDSEEPVMVVLGEVKHDTAPAPAVEEVKAEEPAPVAFAAEIKAEPAPVVEEVKTETPAHAHDSEEPVMVVLGEVKHDTASAPAVEEVKTETPAPVVEEVKAEESAPAPAVEEVKAEEPAPVPAAEEVKAEEPAPVIEEVKTEVPKEEKASDALSLEDLEKDLFGDAPTAEAEAEETKKIDKFYTLYRKNEEFQRLLDEEYDKLKGESPDAAKPEGAKADGKGGAPDTAAAAEIPAEQSKAYRQVEDETIYKAFEIPPELVKAPPKEADEGAAKNAPVEVNAGAAVPAKSEKKTKVSREEKKAAREAAKAEKARLRQEKKAAKSKSGTGDAPAEAEYEEVDTGSGFLTVLAVVIAVILVILLAVILILQVAPDSSIAFTIDSIISKLTGGYGAVDPGNGHFLL